LVTHAHSRKWCASLEEECSYNNCSWVLVLVYGLGLSTWCATLGERCALSLSWLSVGPNVASEIILSIKVYGARGWLRASGWVTIL